MIGTCLESPVLPNTGGSVPGSVAVAGVAAVPKTHAAANTVFGFLLNGFLADTSGGGNPGQSTPAPKQGEKPRKDDVVLSVRVLVPVATTKIPPPAAWGVALWDTSAPIVLTESPWLDNRDTPEFSDAGYQSDPPGLPTSSALPNSADGQPSSAKADPAALDVDAGCTPAPQHTASELAFSARVQLPSEAAVPTPTTSEPAPAAAVPIPASPEARLGNHSFLEESDGSSVKNASGPARGPHAASGSDEPSTGPEADTRMIPAGVRPNEARDNPTGQTEAAADRIGKPAVTPAEHSQMSRDDRPPAAPPALENTSGGAPPATGDPEPQPPQPPAPPQTSTPLRAAEIDGTPKAAQPVSRDVSLHLAEGESTVDIRMTERAGEIRITVHTPDHELANSLRSDLPDLVGKLRQSGFQAEAWRPSAASSFDSGRRSAGDAPSYQEHSSGSRRDGRQRPVSRSAKQQSGWSSEWTASLDAAQEQTI